MRLKINLLISFIVSICVFIGSENALALHKKAGIVNYYLQAQDSSYALDSIYQSGKASYYGINFHGNLTANGEIFNNNEFTCAHFTLPFNSILKVINKKNGKSVIVRVNDRGPYVKKRVIDLSYAAAKKIDMLDDGVAQVNIIHLPKISLFEQLDSLLFNLRNDTLFSITGSVDTVKGKAIKVWESSDMLHALLMTAELHKEYPGLKYYIQLKIDKSRAFNRKNEKKNNNKYKYRKFIIIANSKDESTFPENLKYFRENGFGNASIISIP